VVWTSIVIAQPGNVGHARSIAVDQQGNLHLLYYKVSTGTLMYVTKEGPTWRSETVDETLAPDGLYGPVTSFSIAVDADGTPHVSYYKVVEANTGPFYSKGMLQYATKIGTTTWYRETVDPGPTKQTPTGWSNSIAVGADNRPQISYVVPDDGENPDSGILKYATRSQPAGPSTQWDFGIVVPVQRVQPWTSISIAVDSGNTPHISYYNTVDRSVHYLTREGMTWNRDTVAGTGGAGGWWNALAVDGNSRPHIVYFNPVTQRVEYATRQGLGWNRDTVAAAGDLNGRHGSVAIAVDSGNSPHISYYDAQAHDLRYANKEGTGWNTDLVDAAGDVGQSNAIAVDGSHGPFIVYNATDKTVKCARVF
jgi:hypothetical protein